MRLKSVVLPAPLGPIRPNSSPRPTANETALTAMTPPNWHVTASTTSRSAPDAAGAPGAGAGATLIGRPPAQRPRRRRRPGVMSPWGKNTVPIAIRTPKMMSRPSRRNCGEPAGQHVHAGDAAQRLGQRGEHEAAHHRAHEGARPADQHEGHQVDAGVEGPLPRVPRVDEVRADRPDRAGQHRARREREHLVVGRVHPHGGGGQLVLAQRHQRAPGPGALEARDEQHRHQEQRDGQPHVLDRARERLRDTEDADRAPGDLQIERHHPQDLHERDGGQRQEDAAQPERGHPHREAEDARDAPPRPPSRAAPARPDRGPGRAGRSWST